MVTLVVSPLLPVDFGNDNNRVTVAKERIVGFTVTLIVLIMTPLFPTRFYEKLVAIP